MRWYVSQFPKDPVGYFNLAQFTWRETPEESLEQLATAVRLDPNFGSAHVARAWLLYRLGRAREAVPHLEAALKIAPKDVRTLDLAGQVYLELDEPAKAERYLREALRVDPDDHEALLKLGRALMALEREEEARQVMERYRRVRPPRYREPRKEPGMIELATLPEAERRRREIERFRTMAASRPDDPKLQLHLAELILADGRTEEALEEFRKLLELNAEAELLEQAGRSLLQATLPEAARPFLERVEAGAGLDHLQAEGRLPEIVRRGDENSLTPRQGGGVGGEGRSDRGENHRRQTGVGCLGGCGPGVPLPVKKDHQ